MPRFEIGDTLVYYDNEKRKRIVLDIIATDPEITNPHDGNYRYELFTGWYSQRFVETYYKLDGNEIENYVNKKLKEHGYA